MSMYSQFATDTNLERAGIDLDYGEFRVRIARAGGSNKRYARVLETKMKPHRRALQAETLDPKRAERLLVESYAEGVILEWAVSVVADAKGAPKEPLVLASAHLKKTGKEAPNTVFVKGIESPTGDVLAFTVENVVDTLIALPDLFTDIREQASKAGLFREQALEEDAGN